MDFRSEAEIDHFLGWFETGTLPRYCWTHAAHLAMCAARLWNGAHDAQIREGIIRYNESQGIENTATSGYHETLTQFWINELRANLGARRPAARLDVVRAIVKEYGPYSQLPRTRYSFDVFQSTDARARWIPPDLNP